MGEADRRLPRHPDHRGLLQEAAHALDGSAVNIEAGRMVAFVSLSRRGGRSSQVPFTSGLAVASAHGALRLHEPP